MTDIFTCYECDAEFSVQPTYEMEDPISFCPYCGSEIEHEEDDTDDDMEDDEDYRD